MTNKKNKRKQKNISVLTIASGCLIALSIDHLIRALIEYFRSKMEDK
ncbi:MAG: hypothetical protein SOX14_08810 [Ruminococcus callidus]|nr:hypothetical protein [Ruminococcus callidus]